MEPPTPSLVRMHKFHRKFYSPCTTSLSQVPTSEKLRTTGKRQPSALDTDFWKRPICSAPYHSSMENHRELTAVILVFSPPACSVLPVTQDYNVHEQNCMLTSREVPIANSKSPSERQNLTKDRDCPVSNPHLNQQSPSSSGCKSLYHEHPS